MTKTTHGKMATWKKILIILSVVILGPIILIALVFLFLYISAPIRNSIDKSKFTALDNDSMSLYHTIKQNSAGAEDWQYKKECKPVMSGDFETGAYYCDTTISTTLPITDAAIIQQLQDKYYPIVASASFLKADGNMMINPASQFGKELVVSSAEMKFNEKDGAACRYLAKVDQSFDVLNRLDNSYGAKIKDGSGQARLSLSCSAKAHGNWYKD